MVTPLDGSGDLIDTTNAYTQVLRVKPDDGDALFRLGVCHRMRYESERGLPTDFQRAVDLWSQAVSIDPNQYIWRRRIQQYGPRAPQELSTWET